MIRKIFAYIGYWSGLDALFYWLNRKSKRVLTFHCVIPDRERGHDPLPGYTETLSDFQWMIREIGKRYSYSVDVNDPTTATITFDDGYDNQYSVAGRWLMSEKIPAILFVIGDMIGAPNGISVEQIADLRTHGWLVGWHTQSHKLLCTMSKEEQRMALKAPDEYSKMPMSYPYGSPDAVSRETCSIAQMLGYPLAYSNDPDYQPSLRGNFYRIRFSPKPNKYELHFLLSGLKYFIQSRHLLPTIHEEQL